MKCEALQNRILALADPREVPDKLREHLDACPACLRWWHGACRLEELLAQLPAPSGPADRKTALVQDLTSDRPLVFPSTTVYPHREGQSGFNFPRRWAGYLAGLAASVALVLGAWAMFHGPAPKGPGPVAAPRHPLLDTIVKRNVALARAETPADRLSALGGLAGDIQVEARDLARVASPDELKTLAGWYERVVRDGLVKQAEGLPSLAMNPAEKAALLRDLAGRLTEAGAEAERLSKDAPPGAQEPLRRIADSAREGQEKLRRLAGGGV